MAAAAQPPSQAPAPQSQLPTAKDRALPAPPTDGITGLSFSRTSPQLLLASSWDSTVRLYDAARGEALATLSLDSSVLDCCFSGDGAAAVSGGMDCQVTVSDVATRARTALGVHSRPVRCVVFSPAANAIFSGSWDRHVCAWDARAPPQQARVGDFEAAGKVYSVCQSGNRVVVATSERHVYVLDVRSLAKPEQHRQSSLMHQTRCVRPFPNGAGYALSSVEGRVAIEFFDPSPEVQRANYAFKCHRADVNGVQTLFPVNAIAFHPVYGTFATGGCDQMVFIWDPVARKRMAGFEKYPTSISALDVSADGALLAIASSYTFEEGEKDHPPDALYVRQADKEMRPKNWPGAR